MPAVDVAAKGSPKSGASAPAASAANRLAPSASSKRMIGEICTEMEIEDPAIELNALKEEAAKLKKEKKALARVTRNAKRKNQRLKQKAKLLSTQDLLCVLRMRSQSGSASSECAPAKAAPTGPPEEGVEENPPPSLEEAEEREEAGSPAEEEG